MTGSYISDNGGDTWRMFNLRMGAGFFVFDPVDAGTIYAGGLALWRSTDGGQSWRAVYPSPAAIEGVRIAGDQPKRALSSMVRRRPP